MSKFICMAAVVVSICAAAGGGWWFWAFHVSPEAQAMKAVRHRLKDPESARFGNVKFNTRSKAACGSVNAKNSMGGYVGETAFILFPDGDLRFEPTDSFGTSHEDLQKQRNFRVLFEANCL